MTNWVNILKAANYPADVVVLDFESYFSKEYTLKKLSTIEYIQDDRFEELGVACINMHGCAPYAEPRSTFWPDTRGQLRWLQSRYGEHLEGCTVVAQNVRFDMSILAYRHNIRPPFVIDTLGLAKHIAARKKNHLKNLCERYGLEAKGDTMQFLGLRRANMTPIQEKALAEYANNDAEREWDLFTILLPMLTRPKIELRLMQHTLTMFIRPLLRFDFGKADLIRDEMQQEEVAVLKRAGRRRGQISGNKSFERLLRKALGDEEPPMKMGKKGMILALAKTDSEREQMLQHENPGVRKLMEARVAIKTWPQHQKRVAAMVRQAKACGGFMPVALNYYGAHTGRWSGAEGINLQNLTARSPHSCINAIRNLLTVPEGHVLVITDASQIEARNLAWQAGQWDLVKAFAEGRQIYCEFVSEILGKRIRKPLPIDLPQIVKYFNHYRMLGKVGILGAGYGMGVDRCLVYARDVFHIDIDRSMAERIIKHYRSKNTAICRFWRDVERAFKYVVRYPSETCEMDRGLTFRNEDDTVILGLPSGRALYYHHPRIQVDGRHEQLWMPDERVIGSRIMMWGGYLTENIVQASSRDILGEAILDLENAGWPVVLHAHDEVILVVPEDRGEEALAASIKAMSAVPAWMEKCPLAAEGKIVKEYCK